jgi:uncharacterized protein YfkK (UPF0435 family)
MSEADDDLLMREINAFADQAEKHKFSHGDMEAIAMTLKAHFTDRSVDEIKEKLENVFSARDLNWMA